ncbi:MAG: GNAT family N-acetyltransferase [Bacteroidota bacterium]
MYINIETNRLRIRKIRVSDGDFIHRLVNSEGWLRHIGDRKVSNAEEGKAFIEDILNKESHFYHIFEWKETAEPIGIVTLIIRDAYDHPDIGFAILPEYEGKGYAFEATRAYLDDILSKEHYKDIIAITLPYNQNAIRLLEKLGLMVKQTIQHGDETLTMFSLTNQA